MCEDSATCDICGAISPNLLCNNKWIGRFVCIYVAIEDATVDERYAVAIYVCYGLL
ncbi:MAG: hypothetical protein ACFB0B_20775 [Thermonemataceae bacterium]